MATFKVFKKDYQPDPAPDMVYVFVIPIRGLSFIAGPFTPGEAQAFMKKFERDEEIWTIIEEIREWELQALAERREADLQAMAERREADLQELERRIGELIEDLCNAANNIIEKVEGPTPTFKPKM